MRRPDTSIPCSTCNGTQRGKHGQQCGACFGTGLSTSPWDQRRNATTITLWQGERRTLPEGVRFESPGDRIERRRNGNKQVGHVYLISWPNQNYAGA